MGHKVVKEPISIDDQVSAVDEAVTFLTYCFKSKDKGWTDAAAYAQTIRLTAAANTLRRLQSK